MDPKIQFNGKIASSIPVALGRTPPPPVSTGTTGANPYLASQLPFDILSQVFEEYLAQETPAYPVETLLRVCRSWSQAALHCARLWSTFNMHCDDFVYWGRCILRRLLRCPSDRLLDIEMSSERSNLFMPGGWTEPVFETLTGPQGSIALRWRKFKVNDDARRLYDAAGASILGKYCRYPTPNLRELEIRNVVSSRQVFPVTPSLKIFSNFNVHLHSFPDVTSATELHISMDKGFQRALSEASNVVKLEIRLAHFGNGQYRLSAPYMRLTALYLCPGLYEGSLDGFSAPALQELSLRLAQGSEFLEVASCKGIPFHQVKTISIEHNYHLHDSETPGPYCKGLGRFLSFVNSLKVWERDEARPVASYLRTPCYEPIFFSHQEDRG
jgi:hypothetical protein